MLEPLFEFSGACAGCGETPYLKLLTQLFGDRILVANATGCSSIYGGNLPTTPWSANGDGPRPGLVELALRGQRRVRARDAPRARPPGRAARGPRRRSSPPTWRRRSSKPTRPTRPASPRSAARVEELKARLAADGDPAGRRLRGLADALVRKSVWIVGGDGWAYDIGFGGLDHVLASGRDVNILVLDTEVYSNTGGQASKATPLGAVAKFATAGKRTQKKDLGLMASSYGNVYVAKVALGADNPQTVKAFAEAEAYPGVSLIIAYSTCIAHGIDMETSMGHQKEAVDSGYWPLYRYDPRVERPFHLDSRPPEDPALGLHRQGGAVRDAEARAPRRGRAARRPRRRRASTSGAGCTSSSPPTATPPKDGAVSGALDTRYLGLPLASPIVPSASPLGADLDMLRRLEEAGAGAVVLPSLFEEQIEREELDVHWALDVGRSSSAEALDYFPELDDYNTGPGHVPRAHRRREEGARDPGDRQPQRQLARRMDRAMRRCWRRPAPTPSS